MAVPESSVAVGAVQKTKTKALFPALTEKSAGQSEMTGALLSMDAAQNKKFEFVSRVGKYNYFKYQPSEYSYILTPN